MDWFALQVQGLRGARACRAPLRLRDDVVTGALSHALLIAGPDGLTREEAAEVLEVPLSQVRRVARAMAGEVYAVREGFGSAQTSRYSLARPLYRT